MKNLFVIAALILFSAPAFSEKSLPLEEGYIESSGSKIYYKKMGQGNPIVLIHGGPGLDHTFFLPQFEALAKNYELIFYDQRGSGNSAEQFDSDKINLDQFVEDLECLRSKLCLNHFTIIGHSWGVLVASQYALKYPQKIGSMVFVNPCPMSSQGFMSSYEELKVRSKNSDSQAYLIKDCDAFLQGDIPTVTQFYHELFKGYFFDPSLVFKMTPNIRKETALNHYLIFSIFQEAILKEDFNLLKEISQIQTPTLVIYGNEDFIPTWIPKEIANQMPNAESKAIEECGHFSYIEKPEKLFQIINSFLIK